MLGFLGGGKKSEVYLAWDRRRRSTVAAKLIVQGDPSARLAKEARLLQRLSHPLIVRGFDVVLEGSRPHLAMEHVHGPSLRRLIRKGPLPPALVASVALQTASVLHYLAVQDMAHIDVKPHNILLTRSSSACSLESGEDGAHRVRTGAFRTAAARPKRDSRAGSASSELLEAPTAKLIDMIAVKSAGQQVGMPGRSVPELREPGAEVAPPASVWLLGATMWCALCGGDEPRDGRAGGTNRDGTLAAGGGRAPLLPEDIPKALADLVSACLHERPTERPTAEEVGVALEPLVERFTAAAAPAGRQRWRWLGRTRGG